MSPFHSCRAPNLLACHNALYRTCPFAAKRTNIPRRQFAPFLCRQLSNSSMDACGTLAPSTQYCTVAPAPVLAAVMLLCWVIAFRRDLDSSFQCATLVSDISRHITIRKKSKKLGLSMQWYIGPLFISLFENSVTEC